MLAITKDKMIGFLICVILVITFCQKTSATNTNLTCYQCERQDEKECDVRDLKPCPSSFDRCAIEFEKNSKDGLVIKRKCGLAPCGFDDAMMARGLGMNCDRSKDSYSCVICCKESGCNKNTAHSHTISKLVFFTYVVVIILSLARGFIPPFVSGDNVNFKK